MGLRMLGLCQRTDAGCGQGQVDRDGQVIGKQMIQHAHFCGFQRLGQ
jgi:hypothetical protein